MISPPPTPAAYEYVAVGQVILSEHDVAVGAQYSYAVLIAVTLVRFAYPLNDVPYVYISIIPSLRVMESSLAPYVSTRPSG